MRLFKILNNFLCCEILGWKSKYILVTSSLLLLLDLGSGKGKNSYSGTGINITDPQHCMGKWRDFSCFELKKVSVLVIFCFPASMQATRQTSSAGVAWLPWTKYAVSIKTPNLKCRLFLKIDHWRYLVAGVYLSEAPPLLGFYSNFVDSEVWSNTQWITPVYALHTIRSPPKRGRKCQHDWLYPQSIISIKHQ